MKGYPENNSECCKDGVITIQEVARRAFVSEECFRAKMET